MVFRGFLSPIHDYTDFAFRMLSSDHGAYGCFVPLVNSIAIARDPERINRVDAHEKERNLGIQIMGNNPENAALTCRAVLDNFPFISSINLNCGCPSQRTMESGGGSAMLEKPDRIAEVVSKMASVSCVPVSVKIRIMHDFRKTLTICRTIEDAGAEGIIIHGRTPGQGYSGVADWNTIKKIKESIDIRITGNGDIMTASQGRRYIQEGYCDSYMAGRAAMENPMLFSDKKPEGMKEKIALLEEYVGIHSRYGIVPGLSSVKSKAVNFLKGEKNSAMIRNRIHRMPSKEDLLAFLEELKDGK